MKMQSLRPVILVAVLLCAKSITADAAAESDTPIQTTEVTKPNCFTEESALSLLTQANMSDWLVKPGIERDLEVCSQAGNPYATYIRGMFALNDAQLGDSALRGVAELIRESGPSLDLGKARERMRQMRDADAEKAIHNFHAAADAGLSLALYQMGTLYEKGYLVPQSPLLAGKYFIRAAKRAFEERRPDVGVEAYEKAAKLVPDHPDLKSLKVKAYQ